MKTINISKKKFESLSELTLSKYIFNTEGRMYNIKLKNKDMILKRLYNDEGITFANKLYTLEMLNYYKDILPSNFVIPNYLVSMDDTIIGFTTPKIQGFNLTDLLKDKDINNKEKLSYFIKLGEILEQLKNIRKYSSLKEIYINDLHESNIMVDRKNRFLNIIDLDSSRILNNGAFVARYLGPTYFIEDKPHKYIYNNRFNGLGYLLANENSDLYCYNIMLLNYLYGSKITELNIDEFYNYLEYLHKIGLDNNLLESFNKLTTASDNMNPINYIESLTDVQVARSKKIVYDYNKK